MTYVKGEANGVSSRQAAVLPHSARGCLEGTMVLKAVLFGILIIQIALLAGSADAQTSKSLPTSEVASGVQITNIPQGDQRSYGQGGQEPQDQFGNEPGRRENSRRATENVQPLPPEADIEFQDFVTSSLGYRLPIFGRELFHNVPSTFAPIDRVPITPDYLIGPGDELLVRAWGQIDVNYRAVVDRSGALYIPKVGSVSVAGLRYDQLQDALKQAIGRNFRNFELSVTLGQLRSIQVFVVGQVRRPGVYTVSSLSTLVNALFASGGPSKRGSMRRIQLKRSGQVITTFDLYDLLTNGDKSKDKPLLPGDVIYVPPVGRLVALAGSVNIPAIYELKDHDSLDEVIGYAGGLTTTAAGQHAIIERIDDHRMRRADEFALDPNGLKRELQDGDVVRFLHISTRFEKTVTLRGNVALPGRYPFRQGMRIHDLIPERDFLITEDYWKRQNQLGRNVTDRSFLMPGERERLQVASVRSGRDGVEADVGSRDEDLAERVGRPEAQRIKEEQLKNEVKRSAAEINWEYAVVQRMDPGDLTTRLLPFNLGRAIEGDQGQNLALQPGDVITVFSQKDMQVPIGQQTKLVRLEGEFRSAGVYQVQPGETLRSLVARVGGFTPQAYLYGAEFTRESTREEQQQRLDQYIRDLEQQVDRSAAPRALASSEETAAQRERGEGQRRLFEKMRQLRATGRVVLEIKPGADSLDAVPDLVLEDGDRLFVPFRPATVNVIGSVYNSNAFVFKPGRSLGDYLQLSGGATRAGDKSKMFVIRANGATLSKQDHNGLMGNFNNVRLMPGDTVVVPEKVDTGAGMRGLKDWSQIIGQFALGAAAAGVFLQ